MTQTFNVVRCFSCSTFQVHQVKKAKKWACKVCGEKQSLIKVYGQGTGAECRQHVQKLNLLRQDMDEKEYQMAVDQEFLDDSPETEETNDHSFMSDSNGFMKLSSSSPSCNSNSSKWSKFLPCESDGETSQFQLEDSDYAEKYDEDEKSATLQKISKVPHQEKRKIPFSDVSSRDFFTDSDHLMKKPRTAVKSNFQFSSSVNCNKSNNWSHSVSIESRNSGTNLITCHRPVRFEHSLSNLDTLTSEKSLKMSPSDMDLSKSRKDISPSSMFKPSYVNPPKFTEHEEINVENFKGAQCDGNDLSWMTKPQCHLSSDCREGKDLPEKYLVVNPLNVESGLCKANNTLHIKNLLQRNNIGLSSGVNKEKTDVGDQISPSKLSCNKQNNNTHLSLPFPNDLDKSKLAINSTEPNSLKNIFQLDESEVDLDF